MINEAIDLTQPKYVDYRTFRGPHLHFGSEPREEHMVTTAAPGREVSIFTGSKNWVLLYLLCLSSFTLSEELQKSLDILGIRELVALVLWPPFLDQPDSLLEYLKLGTQSRGGTKMTFDQVLSVFLKEVVTSGCIRPMPALVGDGRSLDLFRLFCLVMERGGSDLVSKNGLWAYVAKELGLDKGVSASIKLIYVKYMNELETWLRGSCRGRKSVSEVSKFGENVKSLPLELETEIRDLLSDWLDQRKDDALPLLVKKSGKYANMGVDDIGVGTPDAKDMCDGVKRNRDDDEKNCYGDVNNPVMLDPNVYRGECNVRKRKRESLSEMLDWVIQIAKRPDDPSIGVIPPPSKWKDHGSEKLWVQAIRVRDALLQRRHVDSIAQQALLENNLRMHPSMYEDVSIRSRQFMEGLRSSERLPTSLKSRICFCCSSSSASQCRSISIPKKELKNTSKEHETVAIDLSSSPKDLMAVQPEDGNFRKHISLGPLFQADVPVWTGVASESETRWLGTLLWPLESEHSSRVEKDSVGRGRSELCCCQHPGFVKCVRFHIAEKRMKLKLELNSVFYHWRFDRMGEEVSLRWTWEEEKRFRDIVRSNPPSLGKCFWHDLPKYFPRKKKSDLVSYYFNVFLINRRSYQNRVTPKAINSDDEETEFGSVGDRFGYEALKVAGSDMLICSENTQCSDLE